MVDKNFKISECLAMINSWASEAVSAYEARSSSSILANSPSSTASSESATASPIMIII